ncbi:hypothetical protein BV22DRAFT_163941 [Leucogyrophana mollusca]|uniref:Uncharacterized protein n=1 Tax=Leucogyrophana mollusca TaxID=85980 RepID=A0ACB8BU39_9AGAM|nr:hypothetical protein BV22DRAFT_163941 [Leucogyrophana mollusca]
MVLRWCSEWKMIGVQRSTFSPTQLGGGRIESFLVYPKHCANQCTSFFLPLDRNVDQSLRSRFAMIRVIDTDFGIGRRLAVRVSMDTYIHDTC